MMSVSRLKTNVSRYAKALEQTRDEVTAKFVPELQLC